MSSLSDFGSAGIAAEDFVFKRYTIEFLVKERTRVLGISNIALEIGQECCLALPSLHAFSGNDYTSSFHGIGKAKALKVMQDSPECMDVFMRLGGNPTFVTSLFDLLEKYVCTLYGLKCVNVNEARFAKFTSAKITPPPQKLPPTRDALLCHCKRVSFVTSMVRNALDTSFFLPSPDGHGWKITDGVLSIQWMILPPAPDDVLQLISCNCKKSACQRGNCVCLSHGLLRQPQIPRQRYGQR
eukprot:gene17402-19145_t